MLLEIEEAFEKFSDKAVRAYNLGILNHIINKEDIEDFTLEMAKKIARNSPLSISVIKNQLNLLGKARHLSTNDFEKLQELRRIAYDSYDYKEGKNAFLEKRHPNFKGK